MEPVTSPQNTTSNHTQRLNQLEEHPAQEQDSWYDDRSDKPDSDNEEPEEHDKMTIPVGGSTNAEAFLLDPVGQEVLKGELQYHEYYGYDHHVDYNYLVLLMVLSKHKMVNLKEISGLEEGYIELESRKCRLIVKTVNQTAAGLAIERLSDYIDKQNVLRLDLKGQIACKCSNFTKLKEYLRKDGIVMFGANAKGTRELFIGGTMNLSDLRKYQQQIRNLRVEQINLRALRNTRSYKLIVEEILGLPNMQEQMKQFNQIKFAEVDKWNRFRELKVIFGTTSKKEFGQGEYDDFMMKQLRKYCVIAFCFPTIEKYLEKPKVNGVSFKFITERAIKKSFMYVIGLKEDIVARHEEIRVEVQKLGKILGVRLFYHLFPTLYDFAFDKQHYYLFRYPQTRPYSVSISAKTREGYQFNWSDFLSRLVELCRGGQGKELIV